VLQIATSSGSVVAAHHRAADGADAIVRDARHVVALERAVLAAVSDARPCTHKTRRPPVHPFCSHPEGNYDKAAITEEPRHQNPDLAPGSPLPRAETSTTRTGSSTFSGTGDELRQGSLAVVTPVVGGSRVPG